MLKVKAGAVINHYGPASPITEDTKLSQESLEHLKSLYPEDIEDSDDPMAKYKEVNPATGKKWTAKEIREDQAKTEE